LPHGAYDGQVITGQSLKRARHAAFITQQKVADELQVALRTIGNWERGGTVPKKHWDAIARILPDAETESFEQGDEERAFSPELEEQFLADMRANTERFMSLAKNGESMEELALLQRKLYFGAIDALDFVESALRAGVATRLVREMASSISSTIIDAGTATFLGDVEGFDPMGSIIFRAAQLDQKARERPSDTRRIYGLEGMYAAKDPADVSEGQDAESVRGEGE
jgi:transcriptional regulator with XRE-family HTH domain